MRHKTDCLCMDCEATRYRDDNYERVKAERDELLAGIKDGEFLMRKVATNWKEAGSMVDSFKRWAEQAREVIAKLEAK